MKIDYENLKNSANELDKLSSDMKNILDEVVRNFNGLSEIWRGESYEVVRERLNKLSAIFPDFSERVNECSKYLTEVVQSEQTAEKGVISKL